MAKIKSAMKVAQKTKINRKYDATAENIKEIAKVNGGNEPLDIAYHGFVFGYAQGFKAAQVKQRTSKKKEVTA